MSAAKSDTSIAPEHGAVATARPAVTSGSLPPPPLGLERMEGRPFGRDEQGRPIAHGSGRLVAGAVRYLQSVVGERAEREAPTGIEPAERAAIVEAAQVEALDRLVAMLNGAIDDERYHVTAEYLLNESNNYSYEFRLFTSEFSRTISGDADFFFNQGRRSFPGAIIQLARPIGIRQTYAVLPRFTAKYVKTDLRVVETKRTSAVVRWYGASQLTEVPARHRDAYLRFACRAYQGTFASIPTALSGAPRSRVREVTCQVDGAECCEWEFTWQAAGSTTNRRAALLGIGGSIAAFAYFGLRLPGAEALAIAGATLLPATLFVYAGRARHVATELSRQRTLLLEQRDMTEREYDRSEQANAELQVANLELRQRVGELTAVNELGVALSATLDLDMLLERSLRAVVDHLGFDRALILLADEASGVLGEGRSIGGTDAMVALIREIRLPLDDPHSQLVALFHADGASLFRDVDRDPYEPNRAFAQALEVTSFLGTPLLSKGQPIGVLAVDNRTSHRDLEASTGPLLFTIGNFIAAAIENARLYAEVEEQNRALEERVEQRTRQLARASADAEEARAAAEEARAVAETASETKGAFLANVSHELRTPLTSVVGFTKLVRRRLVDIVFPAIQNGPGADEPKLQRALRQIDENLGIMASEGERLTAMINDVLDLAKIEAGKFEWRMGPASMPEIIDRAAAATAALFEGKGLTLGVDVPPDLPTVHGDHDRLLQVVINLLSNAVKFTPSGGVAVRAAAGANEVVVSVSDTGIGVGPDDRDAIFEQFRQAGDTLTDKPRGTGLGLPICREIVEAHGGRLWIESEVGRGSTFSFSLPVRAGEAPPGDGRPDQSVAASRSEAL